MPPPVTHGERQQNISVSLPLLPVVVVVGLYVWTVWRLTK
jgi:hypothetical protein